ncbi:MAG TPA: hypothetical protein VJA87_03640 [Candidatus Paceibacterota bacterium]
MALKITRRFLGALLVLAVVVLALVTVGEPQDVTSPTIRETIGVLCWLIWLIAILVTGVVLILGGESVRYGSLASLLLWVAMCLLVWGTVPTHLPTLRSAWAMIVIFSFYAPPTINLLDLALPPWTWRLDKPRRI